MTPAEFSRAFEAAVQLPWRYRAGLALVLLYRAAWWPGLVRAVLRLPDAPTAVPNRAQRRAAARYKASPPL